MRALAQKKAIVVIKRQEESKAEAILKCGKGEILKEFEKVCPTDTSFQRMKKDMHDIFDEMLRQLQEK